MQHCALLYFISLFLITTAILSGQLWVLANFAQRGQNEIITMWMKFWQAQAKIFKRHFAMPCSMLKLSNSFRNSLPLVFSSSLTSSRVMSPSPSLVESHRWHEKVPISPDWRSSTVTWRLNESQIGTLLWPWSRRKTSCHYDSFHSSFLSSFSFFIYLLCQETMQQRRLYYHGQSISWSVDLNLHWRFWKSPFWERKTKNSQKRHFLQRRWVDQFLSTTRPK